MNIKTLLKSMVVAFSLVGAGSSCFAGGPTVGKITQINFCGPDDPNHPNIVQISIEGGFTNWGGCDQWFAAIKNTTDRKDLIAFALTAYTSGQAVRVELNTSETYFGGRCMIARIGANQ